MENVEFSMIFGKHYEMQISNFYELLSIFNDKQLYKNHQKCKIQENHKYSSLKAP